MIPFGLVLAIMNTTFCAALTFFHLGVTLAFEILGPLILSVVISRRASSWLWAVLASGGIALLARGGFADLNPIGVVLALGAGAMWVAYILGWPILLLSGYWRIAPANTLRASTASPSPCQSARSRPCRWALRRRPVRSSGLRCC